MAFKWYRRVTLTLCLLPSPSTCAHPRRHTFFLADRIPKTIKSERGGADVTTIADVATGDVATGDTAAEGAAIAGTAAASAASADFATDEAAVVYAAAVDAATEDAGTMYSATADAGPADAATDDTVTVEVGPATVTLNSKRKRTVEAIDVAPASGLHPSTASHASHVGPHRSTCFFKLMPVGGGESIVFDHYKEAIAFLGCPKSSFYDFVAGRRANKDYIITKHPRHAHLDASSDADGAVDADNGGLGPTTKRGKQNATAVSTTEDSGPGALGLALNVGMVPVLETDGVIVSADMPRPDACTPEDALLPSSVADTSRDAQIAMELMMSFLAENSIPEEPTEPRPSRQAATKANAKFKSFAEDELAGEPFSSGPRDDIRENSRWPPRSGTAAASSAIPMWRQCRLQLRCILPWILGASAWTPECDPIWLR